VVPSPDLVSLQRDLDTDWVPEPWSWTEPELFPPDLTSSGLRSLDVPLLDGRSRNVPVLSGEWLLRLQGAVRRVMVIKDRELSDGVFAYRMQADGTIEHYRQALDRWRVRNVVLTARHRVVAVTDIASFFPCSRIDALTPLLADCPGASELQDILGQVNDHFGHVLPEGYSAARCLANLYLSEVDSASTVPFTRWMDDYVFFCDSDDHANTVLNAVARAAGRCGLELSLPKTRIVSSAVVSTVAGTGPTQYEDLLRCLPDLLTTNDRAASLLLYLALERNDSAPLEVLGREEPEILPASIMPRLAWLLRTVAWTETSTRLIETLLAVEDRWSEWRRTRLATALWYGPKGAVEACRTFLVDAVERQDSAAAMAGRVLARHLPEDVMKRIDIFDNERERHLLTVESRSSLQGPGPPPVASFL
jgi:hypothetical protein